MISVLSSVLANLNFMVNGTKTFETDSKRHISVPEVAIFDKVTINNEVISEIEKELLDNPYDLVSLVFLLYEVPDTALQRLIVFQRISKEADSTNLNLLHEWFRHASSNVNWKHQFLEALTICQLYSTIRKLGLEVDTLKRHYQSDNVFANTYINPVKKMLYKLCESLDSNNFGKLKKSLFTYGINTIHYESCELVLLELMCQKFITVSPWQYDKKVLGYSINVDALLKIIENFPDLRDVTADLKALQQQSNNASHSQINLPSTSMSSNHVKVDEIEKSRSEDKYFMSNFDDIHELINQMHLDEAGHENLKRDTVKLGDDSYPIRNLKRVGVCVIINQEDFYPSKDSIEFSNKTNVLDRRVGSDKDKESLEQVMRWLNFDVFTETNIDHTRMLEFIEDVVCNKFTKNDSIFVLCILSHGVRGHVYAANSVKVKMDDIQNLIDSDAAVHLLNKPKLIIVQACQSVETPLPTLVSDSPVPYKFPKKTDFLIYWATAPELEAYRSESGGSVFIQLLCETIAKQARKDHMVDICTKVNHKVTHLCTSLEYVQVPLFQSTLMKKLYLRFPQ